MSSYAPFRTSVTVHANASDNRPIPLLVKVVSVASYKIGYNVSHRPYISYHLGTIETVNPEADIAFAPGSSVMHSNGSETTPLALDVPEYASIVSQSIVIDAKLFVSTTICCPLMSNVPDPETVISG